MAAFGRILDLFNPRQLHVQDVRGNVEPFPTLIPHHEYPRDIVLYSLVPQHEIYIGLLQHLTDQHARNTGQENWSWFVQWEAYPEEDDVRAPLAKKPRTATELLPKPKALTMSAHGRRFDHKLLENEQILRCLIEIVQTPSKWLPSYVEQLYQILDQHKFSGYALECAVLKEIPSLWLFEGHPIPLKDRKALDEAYELQTSKEQSQRLQYREVKQGIQWPINKIFPELCNVPTDAKKWPSYYWGCWTSRKLAILLLMEAGITLKQIQNFEPTQKEHPKETSEDKSGSGMNWYHHDQPWAHKQEIKNKRRAANLSKYTEALINRRLNVEAEKAAEVNEVLQSTEHSSLPPPLIPPSPRVVESNVSGAVPEETRHSANLESSSDPSEADDVEIPDVLVGKLKSRKFANAFVVRPWFWRFEGIEELDTPPNNPATNPLAALTLGTIGDSEDDEIYYEDAEMEDLVEDDEEDGDSEMSDGDGDPDDEIEAEENDDEEENEDDEDEDESEDEAMVLQGTAPVTEGRPPTDGEIMNYLVNLGEQQMYSLMKQLQDMNLLSGTPAGARPLLQEASILGDSNTLSPQDPTRGTPILLYYPQVLLSTDDKEELHDAVMLGYQLPHSEDLDLFAAIFLPIDISDLLEQHVKDSNATVLEHYESNIRSNLYSRAGQDASSDAHGVAYAKLAAAYGIMTSVENREEDLTKRWRATKGLMRKRDRGAVWEGYGVRINYSVGMNGEDRKTRVFFKKRDVSTLIAGRWEDVEEMVEYWMEEDEDPDMED